jgi:hypothetical protein
MLKINSLPVLCLKRSVYTAIKSISESSASYSIPSTGVSSGRMQAWVIYYYGDNQQFTLSDSVQIPIIISPKDVVIKVLASSINRLDIRRRG